MATKKPFINDAPPVVKAEKGRRVIIDINVATEHEKRVTNHQSVNDIFNAMFNDPIGQLDKIKVEKKHGH